MKKLRLSFFFIIVLVSPSICSFDDSRINISGYVHNIPLNRLDNNVLIIAVDPVTQWTYDVATPSENGVFILHNIPTNSKVHIVAFNRYAPAIGSISIIFTKEKNLKYGQLNINNTFVSNNHSSTGNKSWLQLILSTSWLMTNISNMSNYEVIQFYNEKSQMVDAVHQQDNLSPNYYNIINKILLNDDNPVNENIRPRFKFFRSKNDGFTYDVDVYDTQNLTLSPLYKFTCSVNNSEMRVEIEAPIANPTLTLEGWIGTYVGTTTQNYNNEKRDYSIEISISGGSGNLTYRSSFDPRRNVSEHKYNIPNNFYDYSQLSISPDSLIHRPTSTELFDFAIGKEMGPFGDTIYKGYHIGYQLTSTGEVKQVLTRIFAVGKK
jgi:hypothetical protein